MMEFAGAAAGVDTDPAHLARLAEIRNRSESPGVYTIKTWPSGIYFDLAHPRPDDVRLADIIHSLSMQCRFGGHVPKFYSIAQHSILVRDIAVRAGLPVEFAGHALMHDAHEAYNQDVIKPLKNFVGRPYDSMSADIQAAIHRALGLRPLAPEHATVIKAADHAALHLEQQAKTRGDMEVEFAQPGEFPRQLPWRNEVASTLLRDYCKRDLTGIPLPTAWENIQ